MPVTKWIRHPDFPAANVNAGQGGVLHLVQFREWAFCKLIAEGLVKGEAIRSSATTVIAGSNWPAVPGHVAMDFRTGEVSFLAREFGTTLLFPVNAEGKSVGPGLAIGIQERRASAKEKKLSPATLSGKTFAVNAPDTKTYEMEKTVTFGSTLDPVKIFADVPEGADHVVVSSHGRIPDDLSGATAASFSMLVAGDKDEKRRLDITNVEAAFTPLKKKLAKNAVVWLGSCSIGNNDVFCKKAAAASDRLVVAPTHFCPVVKYPKNTIDLLNREPTIKVFQPNGELKRISDLCAEQVARKFKVPV